MVGAAGFEPTTPCTQNRCATRLRHAPDHDVRLDRFAGIEKPLLALIYRFAIKPPIAGRILRLSGLHTGPRDILTIQRGMPDFAALGDTELPRKAAVHFEHILNIVAAVDLFFAQRLGLVMDVAHDTLGVSEYHVERNERVAHPETGSARPVINKKQAGALRHAFDMHEALR